MRKLLSIALIAALIVSMTPLMGITVGSSNNGLAFAADTIPVDEEHFPDAGFRDYLTEMYGSSVDPASVTEIDVSQLSIESLEGIQYFTVLEYLTCSENSLSSLDVSHNTALKSLYCGENNLNSLDVSKNTALEDLFCGNCGLNALDVSHNTGLRALDLEANNLSSLDVSSNTALKILICGNNNLSNLDVSYNTVLETLYCHENSLSSLDVTHNADLVNLMCNNNKLSSLDVSHNTALEYLDCYDNNLSSLDISHNTVLSYMDCSNNNLSSLDISHNTALCYLDCRNNKLGKLYVGDKLPEECYYDDGVEIIYTGEVPDARLIENIEGTINKTGSLSFDFDETAFSNDSMEYDHTMGRAAAALSLLAYNKKKNVLENVLKEKMGFTNIYTWDDEMQDDIGLYSPYMIAHKKIKLNGENTELAIVVIRGTYHEEWLDDFDSGTKSTEGSTHEGFARAELNLLKGLREYIKDPRYGFDNSCKAKILVTGHSRGAAVANLLGKDLDDGKLNTEKLTANDVFVYTFATPNSAVLYDSDRESYKNIFNIVNPEDFVTKVIPSAWKYGRYGQTYVLPSKTTDPWKSYTWGQKNHYVDYDGYLAKLKAGFRELNGDGEYVPYPNGERELANYVKDVTKVISTIKEYYYKNLFLMLMKEDETESSPYSLHDLYKYALGGFKSGDDTLEKQAYGYLGSAFVGSYGGIGCKTVKFFFDNQTDITIPIPFSETTYETKPRFAAAHMAETYYTAMKVLSEEELMQPRKVLVGEAHCPVDVTIRDADGNVIGQIVDNEVNESASADNTAVLMSVEGEAKRFSIPEEADYTIEITGKGSGTMDYSLREEDPDTGEIKRIYYQDVPISTSTVLTQKITDSTDVEERDLVDNEGNVVEPYAVMENGGIGDLSVEVTIEGKGSADSLHNLNLGDYVTLRATAEEYNKFLGWYDSEGQLLSTEAEYGISMRENVALTAKFTENEKPDEPSPTPTPTPAPAVTPAPTAPAEIQDLPAVKISKPAAAKKAVTVKWKKVSKKNQKKIQGIEIQVATDSGFTDIVKTATAGKKKTSKKIKGLTSKQTYYVRIRAYKDAADGKHVSAWKAKRVKIK